MKLDVQGREMVTAIRRVLAGGLMLLLTGCATGPVSKPVDLYATEAMVPFVPTRLLINVKTAVPRFYVSRLDYLQKSLVESRAFRGLGSNIMSSVTLDLTLSRESDASVGEQAAQIASAATLFLLPAPVNQYNALEADLYVKGVWVRRFQYRDDYHSDTGIYNLGKIGSDKDPEFVSIRNLAYRLINELEETNAIPRTLD